MVVWDVILEVLIMVMFFRADWNPRFYKRILLLSQSDEMDPLLTQLIHTCTKLPLIILYPITFLFCPFFFVMGQRNFSLTENYLVHITSAPHKKRSGSLIVTLVGNVVTVWWRKGHLPTKI